jgi:small conductance mechanosensitive channel
MKKILNNLNWSLWLSITLVMTSSNVYAADCPTDIKAVTNKDAKVPVAVLTYRVKPLTKCELEVEAQAWLLLLKEKVAEISDAEVAAIYKKEEINNAEEVEST